MMTYEQLAQAYAQACRVRDMALAQLEDIGAGYAEKMDDFVRVVRCKDCKHWHKETSWCTKHSRFIDEYGMACHPWESSNWVAFNEDDFCSYGERKEQ